MSKNISNNKYTTGLDTFQPNGAKNNENFNEIVKSLRASSDVDRQKILNLIQKITSEETGKIVVRLIPYLNLKRFSYRELSRVTGYSTEQVRKWVYQFAPEIFKERSEKYGAKKNDK